MTRTRTTATTAVDDDDDVPEETSSKRETKGRRGTAKGSQRRDGERAKTKVEPRPRKKKAVTEAPESGQSPRQGTELKETRTTESAPEAPMELQSQPAAAAVPPASQHFRFTDDDVTSSESRMVQGRRVQLLGDDDDDDEAPTRKRVKSLHDISKASDRSNAFITSGAARQSKPPVRPRTGYDRGPYLARESVKKATPPKLARVERRVNASLSRGPVPFLRHKAI